jgi:uncharacterized protein YoxC
MLFMSLIFALTISPAQSLKLAQVKTTQQASSKTAKIKKAKNDLQSKIDQLPKSSVPDISQLVARLNAYMNYLSYLETNVSRQNSSDLSSKLDKINAAVENIVRAANNVINAGRADVNIGASTISDANFDSVNQVDMGLAYSPISGAVTSGQIGSDVFSPGGTSGGGNTGSGGDLGGGNTGPGGGGGTGGGGTGGGGTPATPSP